MDENEKMAMIRKPKRVDPWNIYDTLTYSIAVAVIVFAGTIDCIALFYPALVKMGFLPS